MMRSALATILLGLCTFVVTQVVALLQTGGLLKPEDVLAGAIIAVVGLGAFWLITEPHIWHAVGFELHRHGYAERLAARRRGSPTGVTLRISQPNAKEPWLDWLHIQAEAYGEVAPNAWVDAFVTGQGDAPVRLMWTGAREEVNLKPGLPVEIPLVIRANEDHPEAPVYGTVLPKGRAYLTDVTFLKDRVASKPLLPQTDAHIRFRVRVNYRGDKVRIACFVVDVSGNGRLHLHHVDCEDS